MSQLSNLFKKVNEHEGADKQYKKIDIFVDGNYVCSTTRSKTCKEAVSRYQTARDMVGLNPKNKVTANFSR